MRANGRRGQNGQLAPDLAMVEFRINFDIVVLPSASENPSDTKYATCRSVKAVKNKRFLLLMYLFKLFLNIVIKSAYVDEC